MLSAVLVVVLLGAAFSALTGGLNIFGGSETVKIPKLVDMELAKAQEEYKDKFSIVRKSETTSDKPVGTIVEQTPEAGDSVSARADMIIYVVVSAGNETVTLEDYVGKDREEARRALIDAGYQVNVIEKFSDSEEKDKVIAQEPVSGEAIGKGTLVTLYVSKGSESATPSPQPQASKEPEATTAPTKAPVATAATTKAPEGASNVAPGIGD